jgi:nicotinamidase-related amidase
METSPSRLLHLPCRYYRVYTDAAVPCVEANFRPVERRLAIPIGQAALVLVDVWNTHYVASWLARARGITRARIVPALEAARRAGLAVIHAPSPPVAGRYGQSAAPATPPDWPPQEFRKRTGEYHPFSRHDEPRLREALARYETELDIDPVARPLPGEPVIAAGSDLQALLTERRILHLFYTGFATNWCILHRDYGMIAMAGRGYNLILLRDATTGIEFHDTVETAAATEMTLREIEAKWGWTAATDDFIAACSAK